MECSKVGYSSVRRAREAVKAMGNTVRVYVCPTCHDYHVTKERYDRAGTRAGRRGRIERQKRKGQA